MTAAYMPVGVPESPLLFPGVRLSFQQMFVGSACLCFLWMILNSQVGILPLFSEPGGIVAPFVRNTPPAVACFGGADFTTQIIEGLKARRRCARWAYDLRRTLGAVVVGVTLNALGLVVWLHYLEEYIPTSLVRLPGVEGAACLVAKAFTHSLVWGTMANSASIVLRRLAMGDTPRGAAAFWHERLLPMTEKQLCFWPLWQIVTFSLIPAHLRIPFAAVGSFFFNVFMFLAATPPSPPQSPPPLTAEEHAAQHSGLSQHEILGAALAVSHTHGLVGDHDLVGARAASLTHGVVGEHHETLLLGVGGVSLTHGVVSDHDLFGGLTHSVGEASRTHDVVAEQKEMLAGARPLSHSVVSEAARTHDVVAEQKEMLAGARAASLKHGVTRTQAATPQAHGLRARSDSAARAL